MQLQKTILHRFLIRWASQVPKLKNFLKSLQRITSSTPQIIKSTLKLKATPVSDSSKLAKEISSLEMSMEASERFPHFVFLTSTYTSLAKEEDLGKIYLNLCLSRKEFYLKNLVMTDHQKSCLGF